MLKLAQSYPELAFTLGIAVITAMFCFGWGLPFNLPDPSSAAFVGMHYLYPLLGLFAWAVIAIVGQRNQRAWTFLLALPCYVVVLYCHFNLKLWVPHINPALWDDLYWQIDRALYPLVDASFALRRWGGLVVPLDSPAYLFAFIALFYASFCYHALFTPQHFRKLFLAALLIQGLGALSYMVMPALGPFLYEPGIETLPTSAQAHLLDVYHANIAGGPTWLKEEGRFNLTAGLGAMPSLHSGSTFLFLLFARRYAPVLLPTYCLLFGYILIAAVANRWHYLIDLPVGLLLAWFCYRLSHRLLPEPSIETVASAHAQEPALAGEAIRGQAVT